ncbi:uncharacterized protein FA14DRAFT_155099 [Meira miltonrushii]|uniref:Myb-like domain-containing protein n=1 Tax=Meira miltonrushii TaxID=1280837 RepID=A0A316VDW6_9BASI|nr:uncharacterized protein FA14DRAFT_155099 [Meira miltonrushii]PWN35690.1 hypothetical protein FA14DRAFT_155099 [Meira miltonrushii]
MSSDSENDFQTVGYAKRILRTPRSKSAPIRKIEPYPSPDKRLTPSTKLRLQRDYRLAIREGSPSPLSREVKKENHETGSFTKSPVSSSSSVMSLSSASSRNTTPNSHQSLPKPTKSHSNKIQPWSDAENVLLWKAMVKKGDGKVSWDEVTKIVNDVSTTTRTKKAVSQRWAKLRNEIETNLDPTNSASIAQKRSQGHGRRSLTASRSDVSASPSSSRALRSRDASSSVKRE